jgi:hypothetical protein
MTPAWTVGVSGFGRCGSTMTMAMLEAGGCPPVDNAMAGSYETDPRELFLRQPPGRAVKLLEHAMHFGVPDADQWRFVWLDRDPIEQAKSLVKFLSAIGDPIEPGSLERVAASYAQDRPRTLGLLRAHGPVLVMSYERVLVNPRKAAKQLRQVWPGLDIDAAAAVVHDRDPGCLPDLAVELAAMDGAP